MNRTRLLAAALAALVTLPAIASPNSAYKPIDNKVYLLQDLGDWKEGAFTLPPYPDKPDWVGFYVPLKNDYKFYVDGKSMSMGEDKVIRLTLRVVSASGAENISYEGFQCGNRQMRAYAFGDTINKRWIESTRVIWKNIVGSDDPVRVRLVDDMCPQWEWPANAAEALSRIKASPWR
jgi:hypothetical protein